ncbi:MAG: hypothetical protein AAF799_42845 [Myxococcota bacterium]
MNEGRLPLRHRVFVWLWRRTTSLMVGFPDRFAEEFVRTYGVGEFVRWSKKVFEILQRLEKRFGPAEAQMLIALAAFWGGCRWCAVGHMFTGNLELFDREGELGPLDERQIPRLQVMKDAEALEQLMALYDGTRWSELNGAIRRQYELRSGQHEPENADDLLVEETNVMWEWVNECTITAIDIDPEVVPPQSAIGKKHELCRRYRRARESSAAADEIEAG